MGTVIVLACLSNTVSLALVSVVYTAVLDVDRSRKLIISLCVCVCTVKKPPPPPVVVATEDCQSGMPGHLPFLEVTMESMQQCINMVVLLILCTSR